MRTKIVAVAGLLAVSMACAAWSAEESRGGGLTIPTGYRGVGLPVPASELAFVKKGDRLDVMASFDAQLKDSKEKVTATILQNVLVADVQRPEKAGEAGAVELILNPNEAQYLALSMTQGDIRIAVRGKDDKEMKPMEMASLRKLFQ